MERNKTLAELAAGKRCHIRKISAAPAVKHRLEQLGLLPRTEVECVLREENGGMSAFCFRGVTLALREGEQSKIEIEEIPQSSEGDFPTRERTILLVGNPNVGKSTLFNALTGLKQHTGNWCGKTVVSASGSVRMNHRRFVLLDTPGTYSLTSREGEEAATSETIVKTPHDCVICVCDATMLERGLILVLELLEMHRRVVLCVNLMDEAKKRGMTVDLTLLSKRLGIPVVGTAARSRERLSELLAEAVAVCDAAKSPPAPLPLVKYPIAVERVLAPLTQTIAEVLPESAMLSPRWTGIGLLSGTLSPDTADFLRSDAVKKALLDANARLSDAGLSPDRLCTVCHAAAVAEAEQLAGDCVKIPVDARERDRAIDRIVTSRRFRLPLMLLLLLFVFWLTMVGANYPSKWLSALLMGLCDKLSDCAEAWRLPWWLSGAVIDGALRCTAWVVSVMLPPMAIFFPLFTFFEDVGLLPRLAMNADRPFAKCRACGKQSLTMAMGFGCNAVGVTACRMIDSRRERLIAVLTNALVPCNGRFPPRPGTFIFKKRMMTV